MNLTKVAKDFTTLAKKHSPEILTGIGVAGMIATTVMAVKATPKAIELINEREVDLHVEKLDRKEVVKTVWKCYIPAAVTGAMSVACIIGASSVSARRNAALATAYTLSETALKDYKEKATEIVGEKKQKEIKDAIAKQKIADNPVSTNDILMTNRGETLCYDAHSGRYFKSDIDTIKKAVNELNRRLILENTISLNEFYYEVGLTGTHIGDHLAWNVDRGLIEVSFSAQLAEDGNTPCVVLMFDNLPTYDY